MPDDTRNDLIKQMRIGRGIEAIVENAKLPLMTEKAIRPRLIGGKQLLMVAEPAPDAGKTGRMAAVPKVVAKAPRPTLRKSLPEMQAPKAAATTTTATDGYVRL